jgi:hypothetical protein
MCPSGVLAIIAAAMLLLVGMPAWADDPATITMQANPEIILADGFSTTNITASVTLSGDRIPPDGTLVRFASTAGSLASISVPTSGGVARVILTSSPTAGTAVVSASFLSSGEGASAQLKVEFTSDKDTANTDDINSNWVKIGSSGYLLYSADTRTIDSAGKNHGVHLVYRGLDVVADALQMDLITTSFRARNAILSHDGTETVHAAQIAYNLLGHQGDAVVIEDGAQPENVTISGVEQKVAPMKDSDLQMMQIKKPYDFVDLSNSQVVLTAAALSVKPGDKVLLRKSTLYVSGKKMVSLANEVMPLTTDQVLGRQVVGFGSDGFFLEVPYYFSVTQDHAAQLELRSPTASREAGDYLAGNSYSLDMDDQYGTADGKHTGEFQLLGLLRGDWDARWNQTETFRDGTRGYFYADYPSGRGMFTSSNLTHQFHGFSTNLTTSSSDSTFNGSSYKNKRVGTSIQSDNRPLLKKSPAGLQFTTILSSEQGRGTISEPSQARITTPYSTYGLDMRVFTVAAGQTKAFTVSQSYDVGDTMDAISHQTALTETANIGANQRLSSTSLATFQYTFTHNPLLGSYSGAAAAGVLTPYGSVRHDFSLGWSTAPVNNLWSLSLLSSVSVPDTSTDLSSEFSYRIGNNWHFGLTGDVASVVGYEYRDLAFTLDRRIANRAVQVSYSTIEHRFRLNLTSAGF